MLLSLHSRTQFVVQRRTKHLRHRYFCNLDLGPRCDATAVGWNGRDGEADKTNCCVVPLPRISLFFLGKEAPSRHGDFFVLRIHDIMSLLYLTDGEQVRRAG